MTIALQLDGVKAGYGRAEVLHGVSLKVEEGQLVTLIGANGAGKTTMMRAISGMLRPSAGVVKLGQRDIQSESAPNIVKLGLAHCPEGRRVFAPLSVEDNLLLGAYRKLPSLFGYRRKATTSLDRIYTLFPRLKERRNQSAGTLSGGEQQMLAIGRALMSEPTVLLLDEPSMGLAPVMVDVVVDAIRTLRREGVTMLLVEQFAQTALSVADYVYVVERGHVHVEGSPDEIRRNSAVVEAYLGA
ncbi:MAG: ABC transporter ATP-binding protein [Burkholderiales bacterium]|nr:MAG: ABC transporter ATP-binding protein [Burkholderiales bacterium]